MAQVPELWGTSYYGGTENLGTIFKVNSDGSDYNMLYDFKLNIPGTHPYGSLIQANNGKLYGMTYDASSDGGNSGILFEFDAMTSNYKKIGDSGTSYGSLMQATNGKFYGMSVGALIECDITTSTVINKYDFVGLDGEYPIGNLIQASNGKLYGMTDQGGIYGWGVIFEYDILTSTYTKKFDFDGVNGIGPQGSLIQAANGKLYGTASYGFANGINFGGVLFEYDLSTSTFTKKMDFNGVNGSQPIGNLIEISNGKLYGMTSNGGVNDFGVIFEFDVTSSTYSKKLDFDGISGSNPYGCLLQHSNGKLYGMASYGGAYGKGVIFEYDPLTTYYTVILSFNGLNGSNPYGSLIQANNGMLYGMTPNGGAYDNGILFEFDALTNSFIKKFDFINEPISGARPTGNLIKALNGKLYGTRF